MGAEGPNCMRRLRSGMMLRLCKPRRAARQWPRIMGNFQLTMDSMDYFWVAWPISLGYLAFQVGQNIRTGY